MIGIDTIGTLTLLIGIVVYTVVTVYSHIIKSSGSLRDTEKIHRYLLITGALIIGLAFGSLQSTFSNFSLIGDEFIISLLLGLGGLLVILYGTTLLKSKLWTPLENISEYSAEFGSYFIATRLTETGGVELEQFAKRFNSNAINLANKISVLEIQVDRVSESLESTIRTSKQLSSSTSSLGDLAIQYGDSTGNQYSLVSQIGNQVDQFINWYDKAQEILKENFVELRSLSEMGNLIAINAAVEASNLEIPNPGFETLASKLRELARSLEERQEGLRRVIEDISNNYEQFKLEVEGFLKQSIDISETTVQLGGRVDEILQDITQKEVLFVDSYNELSRSIGKFKENIPRPYT